MTTRIWLSLLVFVAIVAAMDALLLNYLISHGLEPKSYPVQLAGYQISIPLLGLTFVGVLIVAIAAWMHMSTTVPMAAIREMSHLETIRIVRAAGIALFFFSAALFGPYIVGASGFWRQMSFLSKAVPQLADALQGLLYSVQPLMTLDALTKLAISQNAAAAAMVAVAGLVGYGQRGVRRTR